LVEGVQPKWGKKKVRKEKGCAKLENGEVILEVKKHNIGL